MLVLLFVHTLWAEAQLETGKLGWFEQPENTTGLSIGPTQNHYMNCLPYQKNLERNQSFVDTVGITST